MRFQCFGIDNQQRLPPKGCQPVSVRAGRRHRLRAEGAGHDLFESLRIKNAQLPLVVDGHEPLAAGDQVRLAHVRNKVRAVAPVCIE